jgi:hypothetical protein
VTAMAGVGLVMSVSRQSSKVPTVERRSERGVSLPMDRATESQLPQSEMGNQTGETPGIGRGYRRGHISRVSRRDHDA